MAKSQQRSETASEPSIGSDVLQSSSSPGETSRVRIAERAYELYLARGRSDGQDWEDWLVAEREILNGERSSRED